MERICDFCKRDVCDFCGGEFTKKDGSKGNGNQDGLMVNDYLTMTDWYRNHKPDWFWVPHPNPFACRKCVKLLVDAGMSNFIGGDPQEFLAV